MRISDWSSDVCSSDLSTHLGVEKDMKHAIGSVVGPDFCRRLLDEQRRIAQQGGRALEIEPDQSSGIGLRGLQGLASCLGTLWLARRHRGLRLQGRAKTGGAWVRD